MGAAPRPPLVPAGAPQPWEGSVRGGRGSSRTEPSVFLSCVRGSDPESASEAQPPLCQPPLCQPPAPGQGQQQGQSFSSAMDTQTVLDDLCQSSAQPRAPGTETLGCPRLLWGTRSLWHSTHTLIPCPHRAGCQLCRDFAFSSTPGVFQCLFSYGAAPALPSEVPPAWRALQLCQTCHRLSHGTVLVPPDQVAQQ